MLLYFKNLYKEYMSAQIPFRDHHLLTLLNGYERQTLPLDLYISNYFRNNKALGSKDRGVIAESIYSLVRWQGLYDHLESPPFTWEKRIKQSLTVNLTSVSNDPSIPLHIRVSCPQELFALLVESYGEEKALELCLINNSPAPTVVRANTAKISRESLLQRWKNDYSVFPCKHSKTGIIFHKKISFFSLPEFREGLFEVQDEGSQLIAQLMNVKPGELVLDYCSGSGGKTLAFAPQMEGKGQIFLHDVRSFALKEAQKRLKRAEIQNAQTVLEGDVRLTGLKKKMDWVLVDAPCTGTGTMRRNPDMKWKFNEDTLSRLMGQQRMIFEKALSYLKPNGAIVYATCSLLKQENEMQLEHFLKTYNLDLEGTVFKSLPAQGEMDGFFGAVMRRNVNKSIRNVA